MPNAKVLAEKQAVVAALVEKMKMLPPVFWWTTKASPSKTTPSCVLN